MSQCTILYLQEDKNVKICQTVCCQKHTVLLQHSRWSSQLQHNRKISVELLLQANNCANSITRSNSAVYQCMSIRKLVAVLTLSDVDKQVLAAAVCLHA
jgi:hypothetical protein